MDHDKCPAGQCKETRQLLITKNTCDFPQSIKCRQYKKYRSIDGTCNNVRFPFRGSMSTKNIRLIPAKYADGVGEPRGGFTDQLREEKNNQCVDLGDVWLPNPRDISRTLHLNANKENSKFTHMLTQVII